MRDHLWEIVSEFKKDNRRMLVIKCPDCGKTYEIRRTNYRDAHGCRACRFSVQNRKTLGKHRGVGDLTKTYFNYFKNTAHRRNVPFTVSIEYLWDLAVKQEMRCALSGLPIMFPTIGDGYGNSRFTPNELQRMRTGARAANAASLDRIDSYKPYEPGNVQWLNKYVNIMKNGLSQDEFVFYCHQVASLHANPEPSELKGNRKVVGSKVQRLEGEDSDP